MAGVVRGSAVRSGGGRHEGICGEIWRRRHEGRPVVPRWGLVACVTNSGPRAGGS
ncbi:MAG: hypothetical protein Q4C47_06125 [Planctomycetia bacterium]|nr:hypothetical protein [Planctomycetia bacterium]